MADLSDTIETAAAEPKAATVDGITVHGHTLEELIAADKHLAAKAGSTKNHLGLHFRQLEPGGTV